MKNLIEELVITQVLHAQDAGDILDAKKTAHKIKTMGLPDAPSEDELLQKIIEAAAVRNVAVALHASEDWN
jgi:hypothetical protein